MKKIGILSDTHHCFDDPLRRFFLAVDELWHAGDIGAIGLAEELSVFKPLRAVYGNIDGGDVRAVYPRCLRFAVEGVDVLMTHIGGYPGRYAPEVLPLLQSCPPKLFVAGHSHILKVVYDPVFQLLHINPGAAGIYGFHKVRTAVRLVIDGGDIRDLEILEFGVRGSCTI